jgi:4-hydroxybenzoate polyprenyltransferase
MFLLSVGAYPLLGRSEPLTMSIPAIVSVLVFFLTFELSFEVIYDLRDVEGDTRVGVPTYPVVHGIGASAVIVYGLCVAAVAALVVARALAWTTTRETLMAVAPLLQIGFLRARGPANVTRADCTGITYGGAILLVVFLVGTALWQRAGLPMGF